MNNNLKNQKSRKFIAGLFLATILGFPFQVLHSQELDSRLLAKRLHIALTGTSPSSAEIDRMISARESGNLRRVAKDIVESRNGFDNGSSFYNVTLKDFATPWSTEDGSLYTPLNDMTATVIGYIRDDKPFNEVLWRDSVYKAVGITFKGGQLEYFKNSEFPETDKELHSSSTVCQDVISEDPSGNKYRIWYVDPLNPNSSANDVNNTYCRLTDYSKSELEAAYKDNALYVPKLDKIIAANRIKENNRHYESLEAESIDLTDDEVFRETSQLTKLHRSTDAIAGLLSTRAFGKAYYSAGTNRAAFAFSMKNFFCKDMEELNDTTVPDFRVRRDIDRAPGGDTTTFKQRCVGCHAGMDAMSGAFAYYNYNGGVTYEPGQVVSKMNHNVFYPDGHVTIDDSWMNLWDEGANASLGWGSPKSGQGAKEFGMLLSTSDAFPKCMSKQVFEKVCFKSPTTVRDELIVLAGSKLLKSNGFNMKELFIKTAIDCSGL
jgi:hypothetical protein